MIETEIKGGRTDAAGLDAGEDRNWSRLLAAAYTPCSPDAAFKTALLAELKEKQRDAGAAPSDSLPEDAIRAILKNSYQPVAPRREFETRLLHNLKERQRSTTTIRRSTRRRTLFFSAASGLAAAAMVTLVLWTAPGADAALPASPALSAERTVQSDRGAGVSLPLPEVAIRAGAEGNAAVVPASFGAPAPERSVVPAAFRNYTVADAFAGPALPSGARALRNVDVAARDGWTPAGAAEAVSLTSGARFRAAGGMGHMEFPDGTLLSLSPDSQLAVTDEGLSVSRGFALVAVPESSGERFRLHFPERDIAVEPGTELAVMVEDPSLFAEGGAPAPMVMVVGRPGERDGSAGFALARGGNGVGPLFASQLYRLDRYVTPDLPGRPVCDTEYQDLDNLFKAETVRESLPMAAFAGGFSRGGARDLSHTETVYSPAGFTKKGDRWVADGYRGEETVRIPYLSDAYFGFANGRRDLSHALSLGANVVLDGGDGVFYEIYK